MASRIRLKLLIMLYKAISVSKAADPASSLTPGVSHHLPLYFGLTELLSPGMDHVSAHVLFSAHASFIR